MISIDFISKKYPLYKDLVTRLTAIGYVRVPMVLEPNEFSCRGDIIDIFASNHSHPIRLEFFDDELERLVSFNPHSQQSLSVVEKTLIHPAQKKEHSQWQGAISSLDYSVISGFQEDDFIVHESYGIGLFKGLVRVSVREKEAEYIYLQYKDKDKVYVPLDQFSRLHKYAGKDTQPILNSLHDNQWKKTKKRVEKEAFKEAEEIFLIHKIRQMKPGFKCAEDTVAQIELENDFEHPLTKDQARSLADIKRDMEEYKPMDRLLCGDVGYGKTEVLLRAAFKTVENRKQVAVLVPTTVLASQHTLTFKKRFEKFGYKVDCLSRFQTRKEQSVILENLRKGRTQVVVGTHRLLQKDIMFSDLALLIVDEEQRFGVSHKEKIKRLKELVDVISVSATPIPRTLYMALSGVKDMSVISTPPRQKKPIITTISEYSKDKVKQAIEFEINREGQVFYIFNNVRNIQKKTNSLKHLFPTLTIDYAHGQMPEKELQSMMHKFYNKEIDILVCTTIIENGLDITSANTILMEEADTFGLSQIHQLRGRVGRTDIQGYCYLFYNSEKVMTEKARKRLNAVREYAALGSGYALAMKDLEIRGAGELLGTQQSGQVSKVGFELYCKMLEDALMVLNGDVRQEVSFLALDAEDIFISDEDIKDPRERLMVYMRLYQLKSLEECDELHNEIKDRYGSHLDSVRNVFENVRQVLIKK